jgi:hypothetical protein
MKETEKPKRKRGFEVKEKTKAYYKGKRKKA